jgi:type III restriction enzyme
VQEQLFDRPVELESPNTLRNLSELAATKTLIETFKKAINLSNGARTSTGCR